MYAPQALAQDALGELCPGRQYEIQFEENSGNLPLLGIDSQNLVGEELNATVEEVK